MAAGRGAAASHGCAARLFHVAGFEAAPVELRVPRGRRVRLGFRAHQLDLPERDLTRIGGIPTTTPARTLIDIAGSDASESVVATAFDDAIRKHVVSLERMRRAIEAHRGTRGVPLIRELVASRSVAGVPDTVLETRFLELVRKENLPFPVAQHKIRHRGELVARPDFAYPELRIAIELESLTFHTQPLDIERDTARYNRLLLMGWLVLRFTWHQIETVPHRVADELKRALRARDRIAFRAR